MGLLVDGKWTDLWYDPRITGGRFVRQESEEADLQHFFYRNRQIQYSLTGGVIHSISDGGRH